jgi:hypothetical protein
MTSPTSSTSVYKVIKQDIGTHNYCTIRQQEWTIKFVQEFKDEEIAKEFIRDCHRSHSEFINLSNWCKTPEEKDQALEAFSFGTNQHPEVIEQQIIRRQYLLQSDLKAFEKAMKKQIQKVI